MNKKNNQDIKSVSENFGVNPFVITYLHSIGVVETEEIKNFLFPSLTQMPPPFEMKNMEEMSVKITSWIIENKNILIWGDYDVDGITGASLFKNFLTSIGVDAQVHIPDRLTEGYGLKKEVISNFAIKQNPNDTLIITIDCGISDVDAVSHAKSCGFEIVITDHHDVPDGETPDCLIINGKQQGCGFSGHEISGVATAFFLCVALRAKLNETGYFNDRKPPNLKDFLAYVALGTIADVVPLKKVNRLMVKAGFEVLANIKSLKPGLATLLTGMDLEEGVNTADEIGFKLAPLINAAGRLGKPEIAINLLTTDSKIEAEALLKKLLSLNKKRKSICKEDLENTLKCISTYLSDGDNVVVVFGEYHPGVVGITASKLTELYSKPAIVFAEELCEKTGTVLLKGSCRSIPGISILRALNRSSKYIVRHGGHEMAAGVVIKKKDFANFKETLMGEIGKIKDRGKEETGLLKKEAFQIPIDQVFSKDFLRDLLKLEPHGVGCPKPKFMDFDVPVIHSKPIGKEKEHAQLVFRGKLKSHRGVYFRLTEKDWEIINREKEVSVCFSPTLNKFNKQESWEVLVDSIF